MKKIIEETIESFAGLSEQDRHLLIALQDRILSRLPAKPILYGMSIIDGEVVAIPNCGNWVKYCDVAMFFTEE